MIKIVNMETGAVTEGADAPPIAAVPQQVIQLSFSQLMIGLVAEAWITEAEGTDWLVGTLPAAVTVLIGSLPEEQRFAVRAKAARFTVAELNDPIVQALAAANGKEQWQLEAFFNTYGAI